MLVYDDPNHNCLDIHQSCISSNHLYQTDSSIVPKIFNSPDRTASIERCAIVLQLTYHCGLINGSIYIFTMTTY